MKALVAIILCVVFSTTYGKNDTDAVYAFVNCSIRAASHGIDGLVPVHNPLTIRDINITHSVLGTEYHFEITDNILYSLMDLELKQVDVTTYDNPPALNIDYDIYWSVLNFTGQFAWYMEFFGSKVGGSGTYNIVLDHTDFSGLFNYTKPGQEKSDKGHVDDFTLKISVKEVEAHISGTGPEWLTDEIVKTTLLTLMNHVPATAGDFLKNRFNDFWIGHPERIDTVLDWCSANPA